MSKEDQLAKPAIDELGSRSRASSCSSRADKFLMPCSEGRMTPTDVDEERMSLGSNTPKPRGSQYPKWDDFEKECSQDNNQLSSEHKLDLAMVPVISDQLLFDIVNKERSIDQIDVYLFVKKSLDLLNSKNAAEAKIEQLKTKVAQLEAQNKTIRESTVRMQAKVEQEEEYISNMLLKRIQKLKNDKESLALKYEQEEEFLTNDLTRKLTQLEGERDELATRLSQEQNWVVNNLLAKIRKLEAEIQNNHKSLEQLRREKVDLENSLEHEQEALFNTLGKRMDQLEAEKRQMQARLETSDLQRESRDSSPSTSNFQPPSSPHDNNSNNSHVFTSPHGIRLSDLRDQRSLEPPNDDELLLLRSQVSRLRNTVNSLTNKCAQYERDRRDAKTNHQKFLTFIRRKPLPDYKEFCEFVDQIEGRDPLNGSLDNSGTGMVTLPSPAPSEDALPSTAGSDSALGSPKPKQPESASRSRCTSASDSLIDKMEMGTDADSRDSVN